VKILRPFVHKTLRGLVRLSARLDITRRILNLLYRSLSSQHRSWMYGHYAELFRNVPYEIQPGLWSVNFVGKKIVLPFSGSETWLEWAAALAILGHETTISDTYRALLQSEHPPRTFIDIGANYGLHSILFLVHGIRTISFEPNPCCDEYVGKICALNHVHRDFRSVALGNQGGMAELWFPETQAWLGSIDPVTKQRLAQEYRVKKAQVRISTLDECLREPCGKPLLIKIDVEGSETEVLRGSLETIRRYRPSIVFESHPTRNREELLILLADSGYAPLALPLLNASAPSFLSRESFLNAPASNFMALPA
jgi:FkbM family methyltransferase